MSAHTPQQPHELTDDEAIAQLWRRARFAAIVGALIGLGCCVVLVIGLSGLLLLLPSAGGAHLTTDDVVPLIVRAAGFVALGAAIGLLITGPTFTGRLTSVTGSGPGSTRIRRAVVRNEPTPLSPALRRLGVVRPFSWGWVFLNPTYIIGRHVVVRRRVRGSLAPLWVWIATEVVALVAAATILTLAVSAALSSVTLP